MNSKADHFAPDLADLAAFARALSHPARLTILQTLAARGTCVCREVVEVLPPAPATGSQHPKVLKEAGLLRGATDGPPSPSGLAAAAPTRAAAAQATVSPPRKVLREAGLSRGETAGPRACYGLDAEAVTRAADALAACAADLREATARGGDCC